MSPQGVFAEVQRLSPTPIMITLSGGNPAMQPFDELLTLGKEHQYTFCMETQGSISQPWFKRLEYLTLSPKPPSSQMKTKWDRLSSCVEAASDEEYCNVVFKVVVFDDSDYEYAHEIAERYPHYPLYLQAGNESPPQVGGFEKETVLKKLEWLVNKVTDDKWNTVTVLPQLHTILWGNTRGV
jgi:7-carboxy-7-deazaguanine synthase